MMVLTVNVIGEPAAQRDEARARSRRRKPSRRHDETKDFRKANARLRTQDPVLDIETDEAIEAAHVDERTRTIETGIAIGSS